MIFRLQYIAPFEMVETKPRHLGILRPRVRVRDRAYSNQKRLHSIGEGIAVILQCTSDQHETLV